MKKGTYDSQGRNINLPFNVVFSHSAYIEPFTMTLIAKQWYKNNNNNNNISRRRKRKRRKGREEEKGKEEEKKKKEKKENDDQEMNGSGKPQIDNVHFY